MQNDYSGLQDSSEETKALYRHIHKNFLATPPNMTQNDTQTNVPAVATVGDQPSTEEQLASFLQSYGWVGNHNTWSHPTEPQGSSHGWISALRKTVENQGYTYLHHPRSRPLPLDLVNLSPILPPPSQEPQFVKIGDNNVPTTFTLEGMLSYAVPNFLYEKRFGERTVYYLPVGGGYAEYHYKEDRNSYCYYTYNHSVNLTHGTTKLKLSKYPNNDKGQSAVEVHTQSQDRIYTALLSGLVPGRSVSTQVLSNATSISEPKGFQDYSPSPPDRVHIHYPRFFNMKARPERGTRVKIASKGAFAEWLENEDSAPYTAPFPYEDAYEASVDWIEVEGDGNPLYAVRDIKNIYHLATIATRGEIFESSDDLGTNYCIRKGPYWYQYKLGPQGRLVLDHETSQPKYLACTTRLTFSGISTIIRTYPDGTSSKVKYGTTESKAPDAAASEKATLPIEITLSAAAATPGAVGVIQIFGSEYALWKRSVDGWVSILNGPNGTKLYGINSKAGKYERYTHIKDFDYFVPAPPPTQNMAVLSMVRFKDHLFQGTYRHERRTLAGSDTKTKYPKLTNAQDQWRYDPSGKELHLLTVATAAPDATISVGVKQSPPQNDEEPCSTVK